MTTKFQPLLPWMGEILGAIKKDIKSDYLAGDPAFCRKHFGNLPLSRITSEEITSAFSKELLGGDEEMADWVTNRWVFRHGDIYQYFADRLHEVNPDFDQIKELTSAQSVSVLLGAKETFGAKEIYFFTILNGVVFPKVVLAQLHREAEEETKRIEAEVKFAAEEKEKSKIIERLERELAQLTKKYEQSLSGVQKKYDADVAALKKQILAK